MGDPNAAANHSAQAFHAAHAAAPVGSVDHAAQTRLETTHATAQRHIHDLRRGGATFTVSAQGNPMYLAPGTEHQTLGAIDTAARRINPMDKAASAKGVQGVRTEYDLDRLPPSQIMKDYEAWKTQLSAHGHDPSKESIADFLKADAAGVKRAEAQPGPFGRETDARLTSELAYEEAMDSQMKEMKQLGLKNDITLGCGDVDKQLASHYGPAGHVDLKNPQVKAYLQELERRAQGVAALAATSGAARIELGNEPNDGANHFGGGQGDPDKDLRRRADEYGLVEGSLYDAVKRNADAYGKPVDPGYAALRAAPNGSRRVDLGGMRVDMAGLMQPKLGHEAQEIGGFLNGMFASQAYYFDHGRDGATAYRDGFKTMTDEANIHLYGTREGEGANDVSFANAKHVIDAYNHGQGGMRYLGGILPSNIAITEGGCYDRNNGDLWSGPGGIVKPDTTGSACMPSQQTQRLQGGDEYSLFNIAAEQLHGHITDYNVYGYGDQRGLGGNSDTAITATGNDPLTYFGELPR